MALVRFALWVWNGSEAVPVFCSDGSCGKIVFSALQYTPKRKNERCGYS